MKLRADISSAESRNIRIRSGLHPSASQRRREPRLQRRQIEGYAQMRGMPLDQVVIEEGVRPIRRRVGANLAAGSRSASSAAIRVR